MMTSLLSRFPYPFQGNVYRFANNSVPLSPPVCFDITPAYREEIRLKRHLLQNFHSRCYQSLPHTMEAQWEAVELILQQMIRFYPEWFHLECSEDRWSFSNKLTDETVSFVWGEANSLSSEPLDFIGRHVQEDLLLMMQRDGDLYLDAGQLCFPSNWSLYFDLGMTFKEIHSPIPLFSEHGLDERIRQFLMRIEAGKPWTRKNWSLMAGNRLDTPLETFDSWGKERDRVTPENAGELVHLRVEVQKLFRLPRTNALLFTIHTHLLSLQDLAQNRDWLEQLYQIIKELPAPIAEYKGIQSYKSAVIQYLEKAREER